VRTSGHGRIEFSARLMVLDAVVPVRNTVDFREGGIPSSHWFLERSAAPPEGRTAGGNSPIMQRIRQVGPQPFTHFGQPASGRRGRKMAQLESAHFCCRICCKTANKPRITASTVAHGSATIRTGWTSIAHAGTRQCNVCAVFKTVARPAWRGCARFVRSPATLDRMCLVELGAPKVSCEVRCRLPYPPGGEGPND
jgi:hypothetical protein